MTERDGDLRVFVSTNAEKRFYDVPNKLTAKILINTLNSELKSYVEDINIWIGLEEYSDEVYGWFEWCDEFGYEIDSYTISNFQLVFAE